eukprot:206524-Chlamydomonas_euryale.AAC.6
MLQLPPTPRSIASSRMYCGTCAVHVRQGAACKKVSHILHALHATLASRRRELRSVSAQRLAARDRTLDMTPGRPVSTAAPTPHVHIARSNHTFIPHAHSTRSHPTLTPHVHTTRSYHMLTPHVHTTPACSCHNPWRR